jgi:plastocyanin
MHPKTQAGRARVPSHSVPPDSVRSRVRRLWAFTSIAGLGLAAFLGVIEPAAAARIVGTVTGYTNLENPVWAEAKDPKAKSYTFREMVPTVPAQYRRLYPQVTKEVCMALLGTAPASAGAPITIKVGGGRTTPVTIVAAPGTKLIFQNVDAFPHRLYGVGMKEFTVSETARGARREWSVPGPGTYEIRDELAPSLRLWVVSEPTLVEQTFPSLKGEYSFTVEAPGEYQVQAYFAGQKVGAAVPVSLAARDIGLAPLSIGTPKKEGEKAE